MVVGPFPLPKKKTTVTIVSRNSIPQSFKPDAPGGRSKIGGPTAAKGENHPPDVLCSRQAQAFRDMLEVLICSPQENSSGSLDLMGHFANVLRYQPRRCQDRWILVAKVSTSSFCTLQCRVSNRLSRGYGTSS